jgi:hypothetical protein
VTDHGRYTDVVYVHAQPVLVRTPDGIHFTPDGSNIVANEVLAAVVRDWHASAKKPALRH